jgi:hypothetical protein
LKTRNLGLTFVLAALLAAWLGGEAQAAEDSTSKGAGAAKLLGLNRPKPASEEATGASVPMSCPKCKSEWTARKDYTARGATKPMVWVEKHLCQGCDTTISVAGHGKAKHDVVTHKCTACGATDAACCATSKAAGPTKGMDKT